MSIDSCKFKQVVIPITTPIPDVVSLREQINRAPGAWYTSVDLDNAFFSIPRCKDHPKQFAAPWKSQQYTLTFSPRAFISTPALCHNTVQTGLGQLDGPHNVTLVYHTAMLIESDE